MSDDPDLAVLARVEAGQEAFARRVERMQGGRAAGRQGEGLPGPPTGRQPSKPD